MKVVAKFSKEEPQINALATLLKQVHINSIPKTTTEHEVFLDSEIDDPSNYRELISLLMNAGPEDEFYLYINSPGGNLDSACAIITGIQNTQATVTAYLMGACHSAASMITMYCHQVHIFNSAYMMAHTASFGSVGNTSTIKAHTDFTIEQVERLLDDAYEGFLTKEEINQVKNGVEIWFDADQIKTRLTGRMKTLQKKQEAEAKKAAAAAKPKRVRKTKENDNGN